MAKPCPDGSEIAVDTPSFEDDQHRWRGLSAEGPEQGWVVSPAGGRSVFLVPAGDNVLDAARALPADYRRNPDLVLAQRRRHAQRFDGTASETRALAWTAAA